MEGFNGSITGTNIGQISVDSLKIRIPLNLVTVINKDLISHWYLVNDLSGEIDPKVYKEKCYLFEDKGIKVKFAIEKQVISDQSIKEFLIILVSSKILKQRYFEGITEENLKTVYDEIIGLKVVDFSYNDFIAGECTDCDFKKDIRVKSLKVIIHDIVTRVKPSKKKDEGYRSFDRKDNNGIEFSDRKTTSFKTNPFLKMYDKEIELRTKSFEFSTSYLRGIDFGNICRVETTVKNKKHFRYLGISETSLLSIVTLSEAEKKKIISMAVNNHLSRELKTPVFHDRLTSPDKIVIYNAVSFMIDQRINFDRILNFLLTGISNPVSRSRKKGEITEIYNRCIFGTDEDKTAEELNKFYDEIGLF